MQIPLISVIMPVYNSEDFIEESINSILSQSFGNFEFIIINDASTDSTSSKIGQIKDSRIIYLNKNTNRGNYACRNEGCRLASGKYVCVMDADDFAMPNRLERQAEIMEADSEILAMGTAFEFINGSLFHKPKDYSLLKILLLNNNMFLHPSLIIRKEALIEVGYYNEEFYYSSDYDLMCKIALIGKVVNISDILMKYRIHETQISSKQNMKQFFYANQIRLKYLSACGFQLTSELEFYFTKIMSRSKLSDGELIKVELVMESLKKQNDKLHFFEDHLFNKFLNTITLQ